MVSREFSKVRFSGSTGAKIGTFFYGNENADHHGLAFSYIGD
jgi:hypothetical protein